MESGGDTYGIDERFSLITSKSAKRGRDASARCAGLLRGQRGAPARGLAARQCAGVPGRDASTHVNALAPAGPRSSQAAPALIRRGRLRVEKPDAGSLCQESPGGRSLRPPGFPGFKLVVQGEVWMSKDPVHPRGFEPLTFGSVGMGSAIFGRPEIVAAARRSPSFGVFSPHDSTNLAWVTANGAISGIFVRRARALSAPDSPDQYLPQDGPGRRRIRRSYRPDERDQPLADRGLVRRPSDTRPAHVVHPAADVPGCMQGRAGSGPAAGRPVRFPQAACLVRRRLAGRGRTPTAPLGRIDRPGDGPRPGRDRRTAFYGPRSPVAGPTPPRRVLLDRVPGMPCTRNPGPQDRRHRPAWADGRDPPQLRAAAQDGRQPRPPPDPRAARPGAGGVAAVCEFAVGVPRGHGPRTVVRGHARLQAAGSTQGARRACRGRGPDLPIAPPFVCDLERGLGHRRAGPATPSQARQPGHATPLPARGAST